MERGMVERTGGTLRGEDGVKRAFALSPVPIFVL